MVINQYFRNYELENGIYFFHLSEREQIYLEACADMVENNYTFRMVESNLYIPISNLHRFIHDDLKYISNELYQLVLNQINWNIHHHRRNI